MLRWMKKVSDKAGLSPGSLVHVGEKKIEEVRMRLFDYDEENIEERELDTVEAMLHYSLIAVHFVIMPKPTVEDPAIAEISYPADWHIAVTLFDTIGTACRLIIHIKS